MAIKKTFIANLNQDDSNNDLNALSVLTRDQANLIHLQSKLLLQQAENTLKLMESFGICESWYNQKHVTFSDVIENNRIVKYNNSDERIERKGDI